MRISRFFLLPIIAVALGESALGQDPAPVQSSTAAQGDAPGGAQQSDSTPAPAASDWAQPSAPPFGPAQIIESETRTTGTAPEPAIEWRGSPDTTGTDAANTTGTDAASADEALGPRVDLAGPGTPKWKVITYVSQKTTIDDNIYISHSDKQSDVYFTLAPGFAAGWGDFRSAMIQNATGFSDQYEETRQQVNEPENADYAFLDYTATATHFLSHDSADSVDQDGGFNVEWAFPKVVVQLDTRVQTLSGPEIDLGMRTRRTIFNFDATANYPVSDKTSFSFAAGGVVRDYATELSSDEWHAQLFMDYQMFPKTKIGAGLVAGVRELESNPDQYYQQVQLRATYDVSDRLSIHANGGLEVDEASGGSTQLNPVFGVGATDIIDPQDTFSLDASESTSSSAVTSGESVNTTNVNMDLKHRIYSSLSCSVSVGYEHSDYYNQGLSTLERTDNYLYLRPSIAYSFAQWSDVELAYEYHRDLSSQLPFDFAENIASLQFNFVF
jgi:hypothetical protein